MDKVIRDGKVAILYSPGYGAGWFSWHGIEALLYDPMIVIMVENKEPAYKIENYIHEKYGDEPYTGGADSLKIAWLDEGIRFKIREYDGSESIETEASIDWHIA